MPKSVKDGKSQLSAAGWFALLVLGVVVTIALGAGLMALVFYSARHDMDR